MAKNQQRGQRGYHPRQNETRPTRQRFLIVCEGKETEPNYFNAFRLPKVVVIGDAGNPRAVVQKAIDEQKKEKKKHQEFDQVWCVFDKDEIPAALFREALQLAKQHHIQVAYSNEAFELWYLLHFNYYDTALSRSEYADRLTNLLGTPYRKNDKAIYQQLKAKQPQAIQNAERLLSQYTPPNPAEDNPSTTVHLLVQELNQSLP